MVETTKKQKKTLLDDEFPQEFNLDHVKTFLQQYERILESSLEDASCYVCQSKEAEDDILLCDNCNLGFHKFCLQPILLETPSGKWFCPLCEVYEKSFCGSSNLSECGESRKKTPKKPKIVEKKDENFAAIQEYKNWNIWKETQKKNPINANIFSSIKKNRARQQKKFEPIEKYLQSLKYILRPKRALNLFFSQNFDNFDWKITQKRPFRVKSTEISNLSMKKIHVYEYEYRLEYSAKTLDEFSFCGWISEAESAQIKDWDFDSSSEEDEEEEEEEEEDDDEEEEEEKEKEEKDFEKKTNETSHQNQPCPTKPSPHPKPWHLTHLLRCHSLVDTMEDNQISIECVAFEPSLNERECSSLAATCGGDSVCIVDCSTGKVVSKYKHPNESFCCLSWTALKTPQNHRFTLLAAAGNQGDIKLIHHRQGVCFHILSRRAQHERDFLAGGAVQRDAQMVQCLQFYPFVCGRNLLLSGHTDRCILLWEIGMPEGDRFETCHKILVKYQTTHSVLHLAFAPDSASFFLAACANGLVLKWDFSLANLPTQSLSSLPSKCLVKKSPNYVYQSSHLHHSLPIDGLALLSDDVVVSYSSLQSKSIVWSLSLFEKFQKFYDRFSPLQILDPISDSSFNSIISSSSSSDHKDEKKDPAKNLPKLFAHLFSLFEIAHFSHTFSSHEIGMNFGIDPAAKIIAVGDEFGSIQCFDLSQIFFSAAKNHHRFDLLANQILLQSFEWIDFVYNFRWFLTNSSLKLPLDYLLENSLDAFSLFLSYQILTANPQMSQNLCAMFSERIRFFHQHHHTDTKTLRQIMFEENQKFSYPKDFIAENSNLIFKHSKKLPRIQKLASNTQDSKFPIRKIAIHSSRNFLIAGNDRNLIAIWKSPSL